MDGTQDTVDATQTSDLRGDYDDPVRQLLTIGKTSSTDPVKWPDYTSRYGLGPEHIGTLIRMACDAGLHNADTDSSMVWAPVHAWRALGQLRTEAAIAPFLALLNMIVGDDVADYEIPAALGMIGPAAIPDIAAFISNPENPEWSAATAMAGLREIAARHGGHRDECIDILARTLKPQAGTDPTTKGFAVAVLIEMQAIEAIDTIREAYRQDLVDPSVAGDIEDVEIALGLRDRRTIRAPRFGLFSAGGSPDIGFRIDSPLPRREKVGRNQPCPCGSGKKYKKCCL